MIVGHVVQNTTETGPSPALSPAKSRIPFFHPKTLGSASATKANEGSGTKANEGTSPPLSMNSADNKHENEVDYNMPMNSQFVQIVDG